jgi:hypothetical protein
MSQKSKTIQDKMAELTKTVDWFDSDDIENDLLSLKNEINIVKQKFDSEK